MNDNAKKWIEALRSGEFSQTTGTLHNDAGYCCLGVACEIYRRETGGGSWIMDDGDEPPVYVFDPGGDHATESLLPHQVKEWVGLRTQGGHFGPREGQSIMSLELRSLYDQNDSGSTFEEIADLIESEPPDLFTEDVG